MANANFEVKPGGNSPHFPAETPFVLYEIACECSPDSPVFRANPTRFLRPQSSHSQLRASFFSARKVVSEWRIIAYGQHSYGFARLLLECHRYASRHRTTQATHYSRKLSYVLPTSVYGIAPKQRKIYKKAQRTYTFCYTNPTFAKKRMRDVAPPCSDEGNKKNS